MPATITRIPAFLITEDAAPVNEASLGGVIHLRTTEEHPFYISKINIRFLGQKTRGWSEPYNNDFEIKRNFEKICDINVNLWTSDENDEFKNLESRKNISIMDPIIETRVMLLAKIINGDSIHNSLEDDNE
ncbi:9176_t:CDS:2 [Funneliformis caledonium]|uniref:9176_t:CDS:1 n=1 Tax=Funneliformis caledonium TaxID=1117310 RepID=A0A9N8VHV3_9GLOM|nr:9176_t:CDS:2 [Funneliformis caledonium]